MTLGSMNYDEARTCANDLGDAASEMEELFNKLKNEMNSLEDVLKSRGADELYATYKTLEAKLNDFPNKVINFKNFLNDAVTQYEEDDAALVNEVQE